MFSRKAMSSENISVQKLETENNPFLNWQRQIRKKLFEAVPSKQEGLDLERVKNFLKDWGLEMKDVLVFDPKDFPKILEVLKNSGFDSALKRDWNENFLGTFIPEFDLAFLERSEELEKASGITHTESVLVHELAHASSMFGGLIIEHGGETGEISIGTPRVGFGLRSPEKEQGYFLEEGFAEMVRGNYIEKFAMEEEREKLRKALSGNSDTGIFNKNKVKVTNKKTGEAFNLPLKYFFLCPDGEVKMGLSSLAGFGLEVLCEQKPLLKKQLAAGRKNINELREIPKLINNIKRGLYVRLRPLQYTADDFFSGLSYIKEAVKEKNG